MKTVFMGLLAAYVALAAALNAFAPEKRGRAALFVTGGLQALLFGLACWTGAQEGVFTRRLVSPAAIGAGLVLGHLIFGASLMISDRSWRDAFTHFIDLGPLWNYAIDTPQVLTRFLMVAVSEEMVYRVAAQTILVEWTGRPLLAIVAVALGFSAVHRHFFRNSFLVSAEFLGFALLLGGLYYWTGSLALVIVVHAVRNVEISFLEEVLEPEHEHREAVEDTEQGLPPICPQATVVL